MNIRYPIILLLSAMFLSPVAGRILAAQAVQNTEKETQQANGRKNSVTEPVESDPSLASIAQYEVRMNEQDSGFVRVGSQTIASVVNPFTVRKRGRMYGSVYEYHRNDNFDARNFFDPVGHRLPEYKRNQFGLSYGVFATEKLNIFGTFEGLRINKGSTILSHVPTPEQKRGDFSATGITILDPLTGLPFSNNVIPESRIHPVARKVLVRMPDPNQSDPDRNFINNQPVINNANSISARIDYEFSRKAKLFAGYSIREANDIRVNPLPDFGSTAERRNQSVNLSYSYNFSPNLITAFRLGFGREAEQELSSDAGSDGLLQSLGIAGLKILDANDEGFPSFDFAGYASLAGGGGGGGQAGLPRTSYRNNLEVTGNVTWVRKSHRFNFGGEIEFNQVNDQRTGGTRRGRFDFTGYFTGDGFADFLLGIPNTATRGVGSDRSDLRRRPWKLYVADEWKLNPRFSFSASLAYNYTPFYRSMHDNVSFFHPLVFEPPVSGEIIVTGSERAEQLGLKGLKKGQAVYTDKNDWEPRLGLAYSPLGNSRLVFRSSFAITYSPLDLRRALGNIGLNYPFFYIERAESPRTSPELDLSNPFNSATPTELTIRAIDPTIRNAYVMSWNLSQQYEIFRNWNLEVAYQGRRAVRNDGTLASNVALPGEGTIRDRRPNPHFGRFDIVTDNASASVNILNAQLRKRLSRSFSLQSEFSWNRTFTDETFGDPNNPRNLRAERSIAGQAPGKRLSLNYIIDLPIGRGKSLNTAWLGRVSWLLEGWRLSGITTFQDGRPFNPRLRGDRNNDGVSGDRPDRIGSGVLPAAERSIDRWFVTEHFLAPEQYSYGNSGRNILLTPGERTWDISVVRRARLTDDGKALEIRLQMFNAFNHANLERPYATYGTSTFGKIFGANDSREIEIALKYSF